LFKVFQLLLVANLLSAPFTPPFQGLAYGGVTKPCEASEVAIAEFIGAKSVEV
jgi:hypothetical protein